MTDTRTYDNLEAKKIVDSYYQKHSVRSSKKEGVIGVKRESHRRCTRQEYYTDAQGRARIKYLHVTKGWRDRLDVGVISDRRRNDVLEREQSLLPTDSADFINKMRDLKIGRAKNA